MKLKQTFFREKWFVNFTADEFWESFMPESWNAGE